ncbi:hypothetical protein [Motilimonas cestriensis]|uniref:hypothetical protein n=1 Tax=Motilimonas cestriensis TaxID=2742685 RepID=UPI003DA57564
MKKSILVVALSSALIACGGSGGSGDKDSNIVVTPVKAAKLDQTTSVVFASSVLYDFDARETARNIFNMNGYPRNTTTEACQLGGEIKETNDSNGAKATITYHFTECKEEILFSDVVIITNGSIQVVTEDRNNDGVVDSALISYREFRVWAEDPSHGVNVSTKGSLAFTRQSTNLYEERANTQTINHVSNDIFTKENISLTFDSKYSDMVPVSASGKVVSSRYGSVILGIDPDSKGVTFTGDNSKLTVNRQYDSLYSGVSLDLDIDNDGLSDHLGESSALSDDSVIWSY